MLVVKYNHTYSELYWLKHVYRRKLKTAVDNVFYTLKHNKLRVQVRYSQDKSLISRLLL